MYILKIALISTIIGYMVSSVFTAAATSVPDATTPGAIESIMRVSLAHDGAEVQARMLDAALSADGAIVAFSADTDTIMEGDTNGRRDIFVRDMITGVVEQIRPVEGTTAIDGNAYYPALSADGQVVAFLAEVDWSEYGLFLNHDVFVYDRQSGAGARISVGFDGSPADDKSSQPAISADGRYIAFVSRATNLVASGIQSGYYQHTYLYDRYSATLTCLTCTGVPPIGAQPAGYNTIGGGAYPPAFAADGRYLGFTSHINLTGEFAGWRYQVYRYDLQTGEIIAVSVNNDGVYSDGYETRGVSLSADGNLAVFMSSATNLGGHETIAKHYVTALYLRDIAAGTTTLLSPPLTVETLYPRYYVNHPRITPDGSYVFFSTNATLTAEDTNENSRPNPSYDLYRLDLESGTLQLVSRPLAGVAEDGSGDDSPQPAAMSADGQTVAFASATGDLVAQDTNYIRHEDGYTLASGDDVFVARFTVLQPPAHTVHLPLVMR